MRLPLPRTLDIPKVRPIDRVYVLRAMRLPDSPTPVRIFCISWFYLLAIETFLVAIFFAIETFHAGQSPNGDLPFI